MDENYDEFGNYIGPELPEINAEDNDDLDDSKNININQQAFQNIPNSKYSSNYDENEDEEEDISDEKTEKNPINIDNNIEINPNQNNPRGK